MYAFCYFKNRVYSAWLIFAVKVWLKISNQLVIKPYPLNLSPFAVYLFPYNLIISHNIPLIISILSQIQLQIKYITTIIII